MLRSRRPASRELDDDDLEAAKRWWADLLGVEAYLEGAGRTGGSPPRRFASATPRMSWDSSTETGRLRRQRPTRAAAIMYWHVDDIDAAFEPETFVTISM